MRSWPSTLQTCDLAYRPTISYATYLINGYYRQVLDDSYRRALALPVDRFASTFDLSAHHILHDVHCRTPSQSEAGCTN